MPRLFVAIGLTAEIKGKMTEFQGVIRPTLKGVSWTRSEGLHVTLKFIGETPEPEIAGIQELLAKVAVETASFQALFSGTGAFPNWRFPSVLWAGMGAGAPETVQLAGKVREALASLGLPPEHREFHPHVTLGRVREKAKGDWAKVVEKPDAVFGGQKVDRIVLMTSVLRPEGAEYSMNAEFLLQGR